jgi:hypothetical protein
LISIDASTRIKEVKSIDADVSRGSVINIKRCFSQKDSYQVKFDLLEEINSDIETIQVEELGTNKPFE